MIKYAHLLVTAAQYAFNLFIPPRCLVCQRIVKRDNELCAKCFSMLKFLPDNCCPVCARPYIYPLDETESYVCPRCQKKRQYLHRLKAVVAYDDFIKQLILPLKHAGKTEAVRFLAHLMYGRAADMLQSADVLIPVPLHWLRLAKRQYNQSALIAKELSKMTGKPFLTRALVRVRHTPAQGHKTKAERKANIAGAFKVAAPNQIKGKRIVIIDDVCASGATLREAAKMLKQAGAKNVEALVVARTCKMDY